MQTMNCYFQKLYTLCIRQLQKAICALLYLLLSELDSVPCCDYHPFYCYFNSLPRYSMVQSKLPRGFLKQSEIFKTTTKALFDKIR